MICKYISLMAFAIFTATLSGGEIAPERYTKVKKVSLQKLYSMTKNAGCITTTFPPDGKLPVIVLDEDIYRNLNYGNTNIAIADSNNRLVPFVQTRLYQWDKTTQYTPLTGKITAFSINQERNEAVIDYRIADSVAEIGKLSLHPYGRKKFDKTVTLEFDDQKKVENLKFFNHQQVVDFARHTFEFAPVKTRNIRIKIAPFAEKRPGQSSLVRQGSKENFSETQIFTDELSLNQITFYRADVKIYPARELTAEKDFKYTEKSTEPTRSRIEFDLGKYPVKWLMIGSSTPNYHRQYTLEFKVNIKDTGKEGVLRRFSGTLQPGTHVVLDDIRADKAILTIENNADAPLTDLTFRWLVPQEALLLDPTADLKDFLQLYYGGEVDKLPEFDFKHYAGKYNGIEYYKMDLYPEENNPAYKKANYALSDFLKKLLPYIIAVIAAAIAFTSFKMLKKVKPENNSDW